MGEGQRTSGSAVADTKDPQELRAEIERTRQELGHTVEALAAKTDLKAQAKRKVQATKSSVTEKKDDLLGKARDASPDGAAAAASQASHKARKNPLPLAAAGALLAGVLIGRMTKRKGGRR
ncbi:MAG: DUF3618 domain-containing protein [Solirubrobacteraceae bacterium]